MMTFPIWGKIIQKFQTTNQPIVTRYNCQIRPFLVPTNPLPIGGLQGQFFQEVAVCLLRLLRLLAMAIRRDDADEPLKEVNT